MVSCGRRAEMDVIAVTFLDRYDGQAGKYKTRGTA